MMNLHLFIPALVCGFMGLGMQAYKPGWRGWDEERIIFD
ncbi:hypothetical protein M079_0645 [Bacteroides fragilis str. 3996 N(B) 6]|uniref:Uncharacterized protein n=1 Tax=Bacteroides fragilis str. 3998T(B)3 TaxID=1339316 RepID=A0A015U650_BACFG|nr:hypothetical protein M079_0645 [Bacteroides fragilis str. 3996 N(B) 6]EXY92289.1 hypothetical protein M125_0978 [Bacteroides fragilis str. 3998T(B)3]EXY97136.1 hypothetical protein M081_0701 [Bacteroides fragilis str. 3998 T(B) 4]